MPTMTATLLSDDCGNIAVCLYAARPPCAEFYTGIFIRLALRSAFPRCGPIPNLMGFWRRFPLCALLFSSLRGFKAASQMLELPSTRLFL